MPRTESTQAKPQDRTIALQIFSQVPASSPDNALVVDADGEAPEAEAAAAAQRCAGVRLRRGEALSPQARTSALGQQHRDHRRMYTDGSHQVEGARVDRTACKNAQRLEHAREERPWRESLL